MRLIDTHSHVYEPEFDEDRDEVFARAAHAGVERMLLPNIDTSTIERMHGTASAWPEVCCCMMGVHPTSVGAGWRDEIAVFDRFMSQPERYVAVGEIGLDLYWDKSFLSEQKRVFEYQVDVAVSLGLPISVHCREAYAEVMDSLSKFRHRNLRGVFHSFTMAPENGHAILSLGDFYLGIGGVVTYKNARFGDRLPELPLDRIVLETDCPYLTPVPMRGKRNESAYLAYVAAKLADIYDVTPEIVGEKTSANAERLFFLR